MIEFIYVLVSFGCEWEDLKIYLTQEEAIDISIKYPKCRVEIFSKNKLENGYVPTYSYYLNGKLC